MTKQEFEENYPDAAEEIKSLIDTTIYSLEVLYESLQQSKLPESVKQKMLENFKLTQGD